MSPINCLRKKELLDRNACSEERVTAGDGAVSTWPAMEVDPDIFSITDQDDTRIASANHQKECVTRRLYADEYEWVLK